MREQTLRETLRRDRGAAIREYRNALHLHGDPSQSENVSGDEMIQAILMAEQTAMRSTTLAPIAWNHRPQGLQSSGVFDF